MTVPKLRFREFNNEWLINEVGKLCDFIVPGRNKPNAFEGDIPWITTPDIEQNGIVYTSKNKLNISKEEAKKIGSKIVPKNSVIISCVGDLGLVAVTGEELVINQQLHAFIPKENIYFKFLLYGLTIKKNYMVRVATKTALPYMNKDNCNSIPVIYPSYPEQTKIANFLTAVDEKIAQLSRKCELLAQYKKGVMQQIFSQQLRFKPALSEVEGDDDGKDFPEWEEKTLGELCSMFKSGSGITSEEIYEQGIYPVFGGNGLRGFTDTFTHDGFYILIGRQGALCGNINRSYGKAYISEHAIAAQANENSDTEYLAQKLALMKLNRLSESSAQPGLAVNKLIKLQLIVPTKPEQTKIANFLTAIDDKISHAQAQLAAVKQYKQGLLQQMFV